MDIICGLPQTNVASLVFALVSCVVLIVVKELGARYRHKLPFPIPMEIIIVSDAHMRLDKLRNELTELLLNNLLERKHMRNTHT